VALTPLDLGSPIDLGGRRLRSERAFGALARAAAIAVLVILALVAFTMTTRAWPELTNSRFFTTRRWSVPDAVFGALPFIFGTVVTALVAVAIAVPISIGIALFVTQVAPRWLKKPIVYTVDLLAVVPSVVFGFWGVAVLAPKIVGFYGNIQRLFSGVPVLRSLFNQPNGRSFFTAGIVLAIMITPIVSSLAREVIATCPAGEVEGALALGATRWEAIRGVVLPHSSGGLVGAIMLGLGRAMGETIAATLVIGSSPQITANLFGSGNSIAAVIASEWGEAESAHRAALLALAVTLFAITIVVNVIATAMVGRSRRRAQGKI
jgi:phosphate transport system permease protein